MAAKDEKILKTWNTAHLPTKPIPKKFSQWICSTVADIENLQAAGIPNLPFRQPLKRGMGVYP